MPRIYSYVSHCINVSASLLLFCTSQTRIFHSWMFATVKPCKLYHILAAWFKKDIWQTLKKWNIPQSDTALSTFLLSGVLLQTQSLYFFSCCIWPAGWILTSFILDIYQWRVAIALYCEAAFVYCSIFPDVCLWALIISCCCSTVIFIDHIFLTPPLLARGNKCCAVVGEKTASLSETWGSLGLKCLASVEFCPGRIWAESSVNEWQTPTHVSLTCVQQWMRSCTDCTNEN